SGRKWHVLLDAFGLILAVVVHPANVQDRVGCGWFWSVRIVPVPAAKQDLGRRSLCWATRFRPTEAIGGNWSNG
ncbi:MAG: hypothetical protein RMI90_01150, partial [Thermoguttaceae bacterium]|nr:hypothetical protein [Thermoguttaceae bacterium]